MLSGLWLAACAHDHGRPGVASRTALDCYDWWPYVYSAPMDCWYGPSAFYDPSYFYYQPYPAYAAGVPVASRPDVAVPDPRVNRSRPLAQGLRERRPLEDSGPDLPVPILKPPRTLP